jgi:hypothetical protein
MSDKPLPAAAIAPSKRALAAIWRSVEFSPLSPLPLIRTASLRIVTDGPRLARS